MWGIIFARTLDSDILRALESAIVSMRHRFNQPAPVAEDHQRPLSSHGSASGTEFDTCQRSPAYRLTQRPHHRVWPFVFLRPFEDCVSAIRSPSRRYSTVTAPSLPPDSSPSRGRAGRGAYNRRSVSGAQHLATPTSLPPFWRVRFHLSLHVAAQPAKMCSVQEPIRSPLRHNSGKLCSEPRIERDAECSGSSVHWRSACEGWYKGG